MENSEKASPPSGGDENADRDVTPAGANEKSSNPKNTSTQGGSASGGPASERATEPLDPNRFQTFWNKGYKRLIPIVPPDAVVSEMSSLFKRMAKNPKNDGRGKTPGLKIGNHWIGTNFVEIEATPEVLPIWEGMGAGVGIKLGRRRS